MCTGRRLPGVGGCRRHVVFVERVLVHVAVVWCTAMSSYPAFLRMGITKAGRGEERWGSVLCTASLHRREGIPSCCLGRLLVFLFARWKCLVTWQELGSVSPCFVAHVSCRVRGLSAMSAIKVSASPPAVGCRGWSVMRALKAGAGPPAIP